MNYNLNKYRILWKKRRTRRKRRTPQIGLNKVKKYRKRRTRCKRRIRRNATFVDNFPLT